MSDLCAQTSLLRNINMLSDVCVSSLVKLKNINFFCVDGSCKSVFCDWLLLTIFAIVFVSKVPFSVHILVNISAHRRVMWLSSYAWMLRFFGTYTKAWFAQPMFDKENTRPYRKEKKNARPRPLQRAALTNSDTDNCLLIINNNIKYC